MKKGYKRIVVAALAAVMCGTVGMTAGKGADAPASGDRAKARYYFVEGSVALAEGRPSEAYELIKKAALTDPGYAEANYTYALMRMTLRNDTLATPAETARSIALMKPYIDQYPHEIEEAMNYSFLAARTGDLDEAIRVAERSDTLSGNLPAILLQLAQYYSARQELDKAISTLDRYERIEGSDPDIALRKFALMYMKGDTAGLIKETDRLVREHPRSTEYLLIRGNAMEILEMPDSALSSYQRAEAIDPEDGRVKLTLANYYLELGDSAAYDRKSSEAMLSENIMLEEKLDMMGRYMQNIISDSTTDRRRGARLFDGLLRQYPHEPKVLDLGARYSGVIGDFARARELMAYATDLEPENPDYWTRLAHFYFAEDLYEEAAAVCENAMEKLPEVPGALLLVYGSACSLSGQYDKARDAYQRLLEMELPGAHLTDGVSEILQKAGNLPYESLMKTPNYFEMAGDISHRTGDMERCFKEYDVVLALTPDNSMALNNYAYYLAIGGGDLVKAEEMSRKTVAEQPENPTYLDTLAWILYLKGDYAEALELQEKAMEAISLQPEAAGEFWDHLGDIQYMNGQKDNAVESWKKALELDKDNKEILQKIREKGLKIKDQMF